MALLTQQISRCCCLLKKCNIMNTGKFRRQSNKTWTLPLKQPGLPVLWPDRHFHQPVLRNRRTRLFYNLIQFCSSSTVLNQGDENKSLPLVGQQTEPSSSSDFKELDDDDNSDCEESLPSALEEISEDEAVQIVAEPPLPLESFTLQDYVDHSETLQKLVLLGVDLSKVEKRPAAAQLLLKLDFAKDVTKILLFLKDAGIKDDQLGAFLTKNPHIFKEEVEDLETRLAYLKSKKFSKEAIARLVSGAPYLLLFSVERLDNRLGFLQRELGLSTAKTRDLVTHLPRLLTGSLEPIKENLKVYELELGFSKNDIRQIVCRIPKNLDIGKKKLTHIFDYLHNEMDIPHCIIVHFPQVFNSRLLRIKERHLFLKFLGRAQYDPKQPNYIALDKLVATADDVFCTEFAKTSIEDFQKFLKTL
ncbi:transcription termination factor 3, mitochondrial [Paroedura picta]|uniref:transcription termination factor 3, mitochondrial n=1 Tax=Paroedura picta TaxID=143630 RepID=UPI004057689B